MFSNNGVCNNGDDDKDNDNDNDNNNHNRDEINDAVADDKLDGDESRYHY